MKVIEQCPTEWGDHDGFNHRCHKLWPHDFEHECVCGDRCQQFAPPSYPSVTEEP